MTENDAPYMPMLPASQRITHLLKNHAGFEGPQKSVRIAEFLGMKRKNLDSLLSELYKKGNLHRVSPGVYECAN